MEYEKYIDLVPVNYTDEELDEISNVVDEENKQLMEEFSKKVVSLYQDKNFDPYSFFGAKKIKKLSNKYADMCADIALIKEDIEVEKQRREEYYEQQRYMGTGKYKKTKETSKEEFLEKEREKTRKHRFLIDDDNE